MQTDEITAIATAITAVAAIYAVVTQIRLTRFTFKIQISRELERFFWYDASMIMRRRAAALALIEDKTVPLKDKTVPAIDDVLGFLDSVGMLLRRRAIDDEITFHNFGRVALAYWYRAESYVKKTRQMYPGVWNDLDEHLVRRMERRLRGRTTDNRTTKKMWEDRLNYESQLEVVTVASRPGNEASM